MSTGKEINLSFEILFPEKLRAARAWLRWSLNEAHKYTGVPRTYISEAELGKRNLSSGEKLALYRTYEEHGVRITAHGVECALYSATNP